MKQKHAKIKGNKIEFKAASVNHRQSGNEDNVHRPPSLTICPDFLHLCSLPSCLPSLVAISLPPFLLSLPLSPPSLYLCLYLLSFTLSFFLSLSIYLSIYLSFNLSLPLSLFFRPYSTPPIISTNSLSPDLCGFLCQPLWPLKGRRSDLESPCQAYSLRFPLGPALQGLME